MKLQNLFLAYVLFITSSCNNSENTSSKESSVDTISLEAESIKKSVDSSKAELFAVQNTTQQELDSLNKLLDNEEAMISMGPSDFKNMQSKIGERLTRLKKISELQPLEVEFNNTYTALISLDNDGMAKAEKLKKLESISKAFKDSIVSTFFILNFKN